MPVLKNPRWERLAQELAQNKTASEAMILAGYSDVRNSTRLTKKEEIRRRVEELQSRGAVRAEVSVASLLQELEDARAKASNLDQLSAAVRAIEAKAKVSGLMVQKVAVVDDFSMDGDSNETIAEKVVKEMAGERVFPEAELNEARAVTLEWLGWMEQFIGRGRYPWVVEANSPADKVDQERRERQRQRRLTNGGGQKNRAP